MAKIHNLGFPRIGAQRELKFALESYWQNKTDQSNLEQVAKKLRLENLELHRSLDFVQVGDFSLYDHVLDTSFLFGHIPQRIQKDLTQESNAENKQSNQLDNYFRVARGRAIVLVIS